ncbi:MAG: TolC family protein, partial [Cyclobacteriaceae bacterium]
SKNLRDQAELSRYPNANASSSYGFSWGRAINLTTNQFITERFSSSTIGAGSSVPVFSGLQIRNSIAQSSIDVEASQYDVEKATNDIQLDIVTFYLNVIFNQELLENAKFQLESSKNQLERTKKLVEVGSLPKTSELELVSQVASNEVSVINSENSLNLAMLTLKQAALIPQSERVEVSLPDAEVEELDITMRADDVFDAAQNTLPEILAADLRVRSAEYDYEIQRGGLYPTLTLNAGLGTRYSQADRGFVPDGGGDFEIVGGLQTASGEAIESFQPTGNFQTTPVGTQFKDNFNRSLTLSLNIPIFNGLSQRSAIQRSKISIQQAQINADEQRIFLRQIIETAYNDSQAAKKTFEAATKQVEALEETFRSVQNQLNNGAANQTDFQVASNNLFQAKSDLTRAKFDYIFKKKLLDFYQGKPIF